MIKIMNQGHLVKENLEILKAQKNLTTSLSIITKEDQG